MRLYHYATWEGAKINEKRVIVPSKRYSQFVKQTILTEWPALTFLTLSPEWEPSIQSFSKEKYWEKCCSHPETYAALNIPCWKFEVNPNALILGYATDFKGCSKWKEMLEDAVKMGSVIDDWRIVVQDAYVIEASKWENDEWQRL